MEEDDFLVEAAKWARYYDKAHEIIYQVTSAQVAEAPAQEIIDNPKDFRNWVEQCKKVSMHKNNY